MRRSRSVLALQIVLNDIADATLAHATWPQRLHSPIAGAQSRAARHAKPQSFAVDFFFPPFRLSCLRVTELGHCASHSQKVASLISNGEPAETFLSGGFSAI